MNIFKMRERREHTETLFPVSTSCKQSRQLTDTAKGLESVIFTSSFVARMIRELYKSTI